MPAVHRERAGHLVNAVGVESFAIQNSWGDIYGQAGYFRMDPSYVGAVTDGLSGFVSDLDKPVIAKIPDDDFMGVLRQLKAQSDLVEMLKKLVGR